MMKKLRVTLAILAFSLCCTARAAVPEFAAVPLDEFAQAWSFTAAVANETAPWSNELPPLRAEPVNAHPLAMPLASPATPVPEPGGAAMLIVGLALICLGVGAHANQRSDAFSR